MQSSRRPKTLIEAERHSLEFTSGQLIIAICGLLFLWLVGFLMGVMAGRLEFGSSLAEGKTPGGVTQTASTKDLKAATTAKPVEAKDKPAVKEIPAPPAAKPVEAKPAEAVKPATPAETKPAPAAKPDTEVKYVTERPDRPTVAATQTQAEAKAPEAPKPAEAPPAAPVAETPKVEAKAEEKPGTKEETPAEPAKTEVAKEEEAPKAAKSSGKTYTVQVFSVKAKNRSNADEYVSLLKQNSGQTAEVVKSKDGKHYNVVIGRFQDRKAAEEKRDELKKKAGFADCIVREIS
ncbi:MAG: SPOR domain-containing protein [FCB group bacterium]|jgi:cell division septation protein DedD|nr:SPOR domain-containing protein [FCB group bacterium]